MDGFIDRFVDGCVESFSDSFSHSFIENFVDDLAGVSGAYSYSGYLWNLYGITGSFST
jgi:hypothetical protein